MALAMLGARSTLQGLAALLVILLPPFALVGCNYTSFEHVRVQPISPSASHVASHETPRGLPSAEPRYGGYVLTATLMPQGMQPAYLWAKNIGTLVAYETFLRRYQEGVYAREFREAIRNRFVPEDGRWKEAWTLYSQMEVIDGAVVDEKLGFILIGHKGNGRLSPFFYDDLVTALVCSIRGEKIGVTMNRVFPADFRESGEPQRPAFDTSVEFYSKSLWNTHLAYVLFEADRMLKSLSAGYDVFLQEEIRASVPGFRTQTEMEAVGALSVSDLKAKGRQTYGRVWIELTNVLINTTEKHNVAVFSDFAMEVRAESEHQPPHRFAEHLRKNFRAYSDEFPIFAEVERAARIVAIARWLVKTRPALAQQLVDDAYEQVKVYIPQTIAAHRTTVQKTSTSERQLIGGVIFPPINRYEEEQKALVARTQIAHVPKKVLSSRPNDGALAWKVALGKSDDPSYIAWNVLGRRAVGGTNLSLAMLPDNFRLNQQGIPSAGGSDTRSLGGGTDDSSR